MKLRLSVLFTILYLTFSAQTNDPYTSRFYAGWGYNAEWYTKSNIYVSEPSMGNKYEFKNVVGNDYVGWNFKLFKQQLTIPQYNYRFGFFFKKHKSWGIDFGFDHTKFQLTPGQTAELVGTVNNRNVDTLVNVHDGYIHWKLNNGANFFCFGIMKRFYVTGTKNGKIKLFNIYKLAGGPTVPHVENTLLGHDNNPHFQVGGVNFDIEANYRVEICNYFYVDLAQKLDYANYWGLRVYNGTAKQAFCTYEVIATAGILIPYEPFWKKKKVDGTTPTTAAPVSN